MQAADLASSLYQLVQQHDKHGVCVAAVKHLPRCDSYGNWYSDDPHSTLQQKPGMKQRTESSNTLRGRCTHMRASLQTTSVKLLSGAAVNVQTHFCGDKAESVPAFCACGCGCRMEYWKTICRTGAMPSRLFSPEALAYSKSKAKQSPGSCKRWADFRLTHTSQVFGKAIV
jgi:hypothetical protein